ncbi:MAG: ABC transporter [Acidobacteria bacterium]|nr:MAG: ABC transporter [Acidobacteriota bacterium]
MSTPSVPSTVLRAALRQARTTLARKYSTPAGLGNFFVPVVILIVIWFVRDVEMLDGQVGAGGYVFAGFLGFGVVAAAVMGVSGELQTERDDGTLLRAKAVPHGMTGHLLTKLLVTPLDALVPIVPAVVGAALLIPGIMPSSLGRWLLLLLVFLLTVAAMMPWGAVLGSVFRSMMTFAWVMMGIYALAVVSGFFFPLTVLPTVLEWLARATPLYWIGAAFRWVLLPGVEVAGDPPAVVTLLVLLAWSVVGLAVAPVVLRRMARRQSGSAVAAARERVLNRGY